MEEKRIKVYNYNRFPVGIKLENGHEQTVAPGSFARLTQDDIDYLSTISRIFSGGYLRVEAAEEDAVLEQIGVVKEDNPNFMDDAEIKKKLAMSAAKITAWLADIEDKLFLNRVYEIAKEMDIATSKMKIISAKVPNMDE